MDCYWICLYSKLIYNFSDGSTTIAIPLSILSDGHEINAFEIIEVSFYTFLFQDQLTKVFFKRIYGI